MKKLIPVLLALIMALSICACGDKNESGEAGSTEAAVAESELTAEQQLVVDAVSAKIKSDEFAGWQKLAKEFSGNEPKAAEVTAAAHYELEDFDGEKMDCYLVNVSADVAWWANEAAQEGASNTQFQLFVSSDGKTVLDSITTNAVNFDSDTSTTEGKATYLLWMYGAMQGGTYEGNFMNDIEKVTEMSAEDL